MGFKLGSQKGNYAINGEIKAKMNFGKNSGGDGSKEVIMHEMVHMTDMKVGKLGYTNDAIKWNGQVYSRKDGHILYNDQWIPEGSKDFPWEIMPWE